MHHTVRYRGCFRTVILFICFLGSTYRRRREQSLFVLPKSFIYRDECREWNEKIRRIPLPYITVDVLRVVYHAVCCPGFAYRTIHPTHLEGVPVLITAYRNISLQPSLHAGPTPDFVGFCMGRGGVEALEAIVLAIARNARQEPRGQIYGDAYETHVRLRQPVHVYPSRRYPGETRRESAGVMP